MLVFKQLFTFLMLAVPLHKYRNIKIMKALFQVLNMHRQREKHNNSLAESCVVYMGVLQLKSSYNSIISYNHLMVKLTIETP